jgi:hypothetical protein
MASRSNKIDIEWANSLVGLPMKIPDKWWVGYTGLYLHDSKLVASDVVNKKWCFVTEDRGTYLRLSHISYYIARMCA